VQRRPELLERLADWLAAGPAPALTRPRLLVVGPATPELTGLAAHVSAGITTVAAGGAPAGASAVDAEVDAGCDLLLLATPGVDAAAPVLAIAACADEEPVRAVGFDSGLEDAEWMRQVVAVRDGLRVLDLSAGRDSVLAALPDPLLATAVGAVEQAARRRTPVVLDGTGALAAAVLGLRLSALPAALQLASAPVGRAAVLAQRILGLDPILDVGEHGEDGSAALLALALLRAAVLPAYESTSPGAPAAQLPGTTSGDQDLPSVDT